MACKSIFWYIYGGCLILCFWKLVEDIFRSLKECFIFWLIPLISFYFDYRIGECCKVTWACVGAMEEWMFLGTRSICLVIFYCVRVFTSSPSHVEMFDCVIQVEWSSCIVEWSIQSKTTMAKSSLSRFYEGKESPNCKGNKNLLNECQVKCGLRFFFLCSASH